MDTFDFYHLAEGQDGKFLIMKNGEFLLECTGTRKDAENIVRLLNEDVERTRKEKGALKGIEAPVIIPADQKGERQ